MFKRVLALIIKELQTLLGASELLSCEPQHRLEAYATLHRRVVGVGAPNSRQEAFREIDRHSGEQRSIVVQPVSGFEVKTGLNRHRPAQTFLIEC
jgi:hypothetical protein